MVPAHEIIIQPEAVEALRMIEQSHPNQLLGAAGPNCRLITTTTPAAVQGRSGMTAAECGNGRLNIQQAGISNEIMVVPDGVNHTRTVGGGGEGNAHVTEGTAEVVEEEVILGTEQPVSQCQIPIGNQSKIDGSLLLQALEGRKKVLLELREDEQGEEEHEQELTEIAEGEGVQLPAGAQPVRQQTYYIFHPGSQTFEPVTIAEFMEQPVAQEVVVGNATEARSAASGTIVGQEEEITGELKQAGEVDGPIEEEAGGQEVFILNESGAAGQQIQPVQLQRRPVNSNNPNGIQFDSRNEDHKIVQEYLRLQQERNQPLQRRPTVPGHHVQTANDQTQQHLNYVVDHPVSQPNEDDSIDDDCQVLSYGDEIHVYKKPTEHIDIEDLVDMEFEEEFNRRKNEARIKSSQEKASSSTQSQDVDMIVPDMTAAVTTTSQPTTELNLTNTQRNNTGHQPSSSACLPVVQPVVEKFTATNRTDAFTLDTPRNVDERRGVKRPLPDLVAADGPCPSATKSVSTTPLASSEIPSTEPTLSSDMSSSTANVPVLSSDESSHLKTPASTALLQSTITTPIISTNTPDLSTPIASSTTSSISSAMPKSSTLLNLPPTTKVSSTTSLISSAVPGSSTYSLPFTTTASSNSSTILPPTTTASLITLSISPVIPKSLSTTSLPTSTAEPSSSISTPDSSTLSVPPSDVPSSTTASSITTPVHSEGMSSLLMTPVALSLPPSATQNQKVENQNMESQTAVASVMDEQGR